VARRSKKKRPKSKTLAVIALVVAAACSREVRTPSQTAKARVKPSVEAGADVGDPMPSYGTKLLDGKSFDVASEKGNVVLLNVWATWCQPCRFETPELQALHEKYSSRGFKIVGVSVDDGNDAEIKKFIEENKITYPIGLDPEGRVANVLRTTVIPTSVLIGRDGRIAWRKVGAVMPNETAAVDNVIERALGKKI